MAQRQRHKTAASETSSDDVDDHDRPRSILKPTPSSDVAVRSSRPTFAQGLYDSDNYSSDVSVIIKYTLRAIKKCAIWFLTVTLAFLE